MRAVLAVLFVVCLAAPAAAQGPRFDVSGGYSVLRDTEIDQNFNGWVASVSGNLNPWFGVVGEVGGNYKSETFETIDVDLSMYSFMGGARFTSRANPAIAPFAQVLAGGVRLGASFAGESDSQTKFALQPGAGLDIWFAPYVGLRVGGDYRHIFLEEDEGPDEFRFHVGIVIAGR
jgi:opacity protein-like surface antigen